MAILRTPLNLNDEILPEEIPLPPNTPEDDAALKLVLSDLHRAEYYVLAKGMTVQWDRDDRLYLFRMPQAFWEGSSVPRSSLGMPLILEHIESLLPQFMQALFSDNPPFDIEARRKTKQETARAVKEIIAEQLDQMGFQEEIRLCLKESLQYGMGVLKWGWKREKHFRRRYSYEGAPNIKSIAGGMTVTEPTKSSRKVLETLEEYEINQPYVEKVHIRHLVVDPSLRVPDIQNAKYIIHRTYPTLQELEQFRNYKGYTLPPTEELQALFAPPKESPERSLLEGRSTTSVLNTGVSSLDINMEFKAMPRWQDASEDPTQQPLELLEYTSCARSIVVLNRKLVLKNDINEFECVNYLSVPFIDVLDSWYGIGVAKLLNGEQRLQQGVINSRLDDLALRLSGTFLRKRGGNTPTQQLRLRPGGIIDSDDEKGVTMIQYPPAITDAFSEVEASDQRSQRRTGANEIVTQGTLTQPSSITRTGTGMGTLAKAVGARASYFVDFFCQLVFIPVLKKIHEMNARWLPIEDIEQILDDVLTKAFEGDAIDVKNATVKFKMEAGSMMRAKAAFQQLLMPMVQLLTSAPVLDACQDQEKKVDMMEVVQQIFDIVGWPGIQSIIVDLTEEDKKRIQAKSEIAQQQSVIAQKHRATMEEIEQKGLAQSGTHVVRGIIDQLSPDKQIALLQALKEMTQALTENQNQQTETQGQQGASQGENNGGSSDTGS